MCHFHSPNRRLAVVALSDLGSGERALLSVVRLWFRGHSDTPAGLATMRERMRAGGGPDTVLLPLCSMLAVLKRTANRPLDIHCPDCARLGADESDLLSIFSSCQRRRSERAATILGNWLSPLLCRHIEDLAQQVARGLADGPTALLLRDFGSTRRDDSTVPVVGAD